MAIFCYNVVFSFIGLLCCINGQENGNLSPILYELDNTENNLLGNSVDSDFMLSSDRDNDNNIQLWNKISGIFNYKLKIFENMMSGINRWSFDKILFNNVSLNPTEQMIFTQYGNRKLEENNSKRIPRQADITIQTEYIDSQLKTTLSTPSNIPIKGIENQSPSHLNSSLTINLTSTTIINDLLLNSSTINSTSITSTSLPLTSSLAINDNQTIQINVTSKDKIMILSDTLPVQQNHYVVGVIFLGITIILATGLFIVYKKYQDRSRRACYHIGYVCDNNAHEETPI